MYKLLLILFPCFVHPYFFDCSPCDCGINIDKIEANCDYNFCKEKLGHIPNNLDKKIQVLHFEDQSLTKIDDNSLSEYTLLEKIVLDKNKISYLSNTSLASLNKLMEIILSNNLISELPQNLFNDNINLKYIWLNNNKIISLPSKMFSDLKYLKEVHLEENNIKYISEYCFFNVPSISVIDLSKNNLETLQLNIFNDYSSITHLILHDNPWVCDANLCQIQIMAMKQFWLTTTPKCNSPEILHNQFWKDLTSTPKTQTLYVNEGENIELTCSFDGCNSPKFKWIHEIDSQQQHSIILRNVNKNNAGNYKCFIENCVNCEENFHLEVTEIMEQDHESQVNQAVEAATSELMLVLYIALGILLAVVLFTCFMCCPCCQISSCCVTLSACFIGLLTSIGNCCCKLVRSNEDRI